MSVKPGKPAKIPKTEKETGEAPGEGKTTKPSKGSKPVVLTPVGTTPQGRPSFGVCPACGSGSIIEGQRGYGCDRFRQGCSYVVWKEVCGRALTRQNIEALIQGGQTRNMTGFITPDGRSVSGRVRMKSDRSGIEFVEDERESKA